MVKFLSEEDAENARLKLEEDMSKDIPEELKEFTQHKIKAVS